MLFVSFCGDPACDGFTAVHMLLSVGHNVGGDITRLRLASCVRLQTQSAVHLRARQLPRESQKLDVTRYPVHNKLTKAWFDARHETHARVPASILAYFTAVYCVSIGARALCQNVDRIISTRCQ